jgi:hypothetical protein
MAGHGVMQEIRTLLSQGKSSGEVIALGYKPPTVYKVQRQLNRKIQGGGSSPVQALGQAPVMTVNTQARPDLEAENEELRAEIEGLQEKAEEAETLRLQLDQANITVHSLVARSEALASERDNLRNKASNLEAQLGDAFPTCPKCGQGRSCHFGHRGETTWICPVSHHSITR